MKCLLAHSCCRVGVGMMKSTTEHKRAGMACIAKVQFRMRIVVVSYNCLVIYANSIQRNGMEM